MVFDLNHWAMSQREILLRTFSVALGTHRSADPPPSLTRPTYIGAKARRPFLDSPLGALPDASCTPLSRWSQSTAKRLFDCVCVVTILPILIPVLLLVALAVRLTSFGPVFFLQTRIGRGGRPFTIFKFRTVIHSPRSTQSGDQFFTCIGPFLRRWKLDELPQLFNVLRGDLSLVGPRPKMREYQLGTPQCRPGITGAATIVFAREEELLQLVSELRFRDTYRTMVMPAKFRLDAEYMGRATFLGDLQLLVNTVLRRWDLDTLGALISAMPLESLPHEPKSRACVRFAPRQAPTLPRMNCPTGQ